MKTTALGILVLTIALGAAPQAQANPGLRPGEQDYIHNLESIGIFSRSDPTNVNLVRIGKNVCADLAMGASPEQVAATLYAESNTKSAGISRTQSAQLVQYAQHDLCPPPVGTGVKIGGVIE